MGRRPARWAWSKVRTVHGARPQDTVACDGGIYTYQYRLYPPTGALCERCVGLAWCSTCREYTADMVFVPREERLPDPLAGLPASERKRLERSEIKLLDFVDRLVRRGAWPKRQP